MPGPGRLRIHGVWSEPSLFNVCLLCFSHSSRRLHTIGAHGFPGKVAVVACRCRSRPSREFLLQAGQFLTETRRPVNLCLRRAAS